MKSAVDSDRLQSFGGSNFDGSKKSLFILVAAVIFATYVACESLGKDLHINDEQLYGYASFLYKKGEYYRAITEYKRLLYFFPESSLAGISRMQIGRSYMAGGSQEEAIDFWNKQLGEAEVSEPDLQHIKRLLGISLLDWNATYLFSFRKEGIEEAVALFSTLEERNEADRLILDFSGEWKNREVEGKKSPWLAGTLSTIMPGAGSFYTGRYLEGIYAFFITGLFLGATRDAVVSERDDLSVVFGLLTAVFYGGNIYTAVNGAHKLNDNQESAELMRLRQKYGIWFIPATGRHPGRF